MSKNMSYNQRRKIEARQKKEKADRRDKLIANVERELAVLHKTALKGQDFTVQEREQIDNASRCISSVRGGWCNKRMR